MSGAFREIAQDAINRAREQDVSSSELRDGLLVISNMVNDSVADAERELEDARSDDGA